MKKFVGKNGEKRHFFILTTIGFGSRGSSVRIRPRRPSISPIEISTSSEFGSHEAFELLSHLFLSLAREQNGVCGKSVGKKDSTPDGALTSIIDHFSKNHSNNFGGVRSRASASIYGLRAFNPRDVPIRQDRFRELQPARRTFSFLSGPNRGAEYGLQFRDDGNDIRSDLSARVARSNLLKKGLSHNCLYGISPDIGPGDTNGCGLGIPHPSTARNTHKTHGRGLHGIRLHRHKSGWRRKDRPHVELEAPHEAISSAAQANRYLKRLPTL
jgi:hypothetical protein